MDFRIHKRQWFVGFAALTLAVVAVGCGNNTVTVDVDVTSFIADEDLSNNYSSPVSIPVSIDLDAIEVNLLEGSQDFAKAEELSIEMAIRYDNESGAGEASFTVFFADTPEGVYNTAPVATVPAVLVSPTSPEPFSVSNSSARFDADTRVLDLFTNERLYMGLRFNYAPSSVQALAGSYTITSLMAHVVSKVEIF